MTQPGRQIPQAARAVAESCKFLQPRILPTERKVWLPKRYVEMPRNPYALLCGTKGGDYCPMAHACARGYLVTSTSTSYILYGAEMERKTLVGSQFNRIKT